MNFRGCKAEPCQALFKIRETILINYLCTFV